jgi:hypothetical protein
VRRADSLTIPGPTMACTKSAQDADDDANTSVINAFCHKQNACVKAVGFYKKKKKKVTAHATRVAQHEHTKCVSRKTPVVL